MLHLESIVHLIALYVFPNFFHLCSTENDSHDSLKLGLTALSWVNAVSVCRNSDLAASGAGNGSVQLWAVEAETKGIRPLFALSLVSLLSLYLPRSQSTFDYAMISIASH